MSFRFSSMWKSMKFRVPTVCTQLANVAVEAPIKGRKTTVKAGNIHPSPYLEKALAIQVLLSRVRSTVLIYVCEMSYARCVFVCDSALHITHTYVLNYSAYGAGEEARTVSTCAPI